MENSFVAYLEAHAPHRLPWRRPVPDMPWPREMSHGTTCLALTYDGGVVMAGDRRATAGNMIAQNRLEKVHPADPYAAIAFAGAVGIALEMIKLYRVELEHYEKIEGAQLTLRGKANRLASMVRSNLPLTMRGLAMLPLLAGWDFQEGRGRIFGYDAVGDVQEEKPYAAVGSGSVFAKSAMKKLVRGPLTETAAARIAVEALYDAADDDTATGGPDLVRSIYPIVAVVDADGYRRYDDESVGVLARAVVSERRAAAAG